MGVTGKTFKQKRVNGEDLLVSKKQKDYIPNVKIVASRKMKAKRLECLDDECRKNMNGFFL